MPKIDPYTPEKNYSLKRECDKNIRIASRDKLFDKYDGSVIYRFKNKKTDERLIGKTDNLKSRVYAYHSEIKQGKTPFAKAVRKDPTNFVFGIIKKLSKNEDSSRLEQKCIKEKESIDYGFNRRNGGGGGRAKTTKTTSEKTIDAAEDLIATKHKTPKKWYPLKEKDDDTLYFDVTPKTKKQNGIYCIKRIFKTPGGTKTKKRYIGQTSRSYSKRFSEHTHYANHPEKTANPLYKEMHKSNPSEFFVAKLPTYKLPLDVAEKAFIRHYESDDLDTGYNKNSGGGGPCLAK